VRQSLIAIHATWLIGFALITAEWVTAHPSSLDAERQLEQGYLRNDASAIASVNETLEARLASAHEDQELLDTRAFGYYALATALRSRSQDKEAIAALGEAVGLLEAVKNEPFRTEALALHGHINGMLIGLKGGLSGMTLGRRANELLLAAERSAPANPRVLMFSGVSLLHRPAAFGGDAAKAAQVLARAAAIFDAMIASSQSPQWGQAETLMWLGLARQRSGDAGGAHAAWERALEIEPNYWIVSTTLLPSLD
jgi:tetratricopeptide (TPR) repeat protein